MVLVRTADPTDAAATARNTITSYRLVVVPSSAVTVTGIVFSPGLTAMETLALPADVTAVLPILKCAPGSVTPAARDIDVEPAPIEKL